MTASSNVSNVKPTSVVHSAGVTSFEQLYNDWHDHVARWVRAMAGPRVEGEDLVQEVFISAHKAYSRFDGRNPAGWLFQIAKRRVLDQRRSWWFVHLVQGREERSTDELPTPQAGPEETLAARQERRLFYELLEKLSLKQRTVFMLYEVEGYSGEEIAALEGIPINTVWTRLHHARKDFFAAAARHQAKQG